MKKLLILPLFCILAIRCMASQILWAALDESSIVSIGGRSILFLDYQNQSGEIINAARIVADGNPAPLWFPEYQGNPGYWETDFPEICLRNEDGWYGMARYSSQFGMGENPDDSMPVIFELGYIDWNDENAQFITLATANSTYGQLNSEKHIYPSGTLLPPVEADWMPTIFYATEIPPVPEPSIPILTMLGICAILMRRRFS